MATPHLTIEQSLPFIWIAIVLFSIILGALNIHTRKRIFFILEVGLLLFLALFLYSPSNSKASGLDLKTTLIIGLTGLIGFIAGFIGVYMIKKFRGTLKDDEIFSLHKFNEQIVKRGNKKDKNDLK